jgi:hypothetical protein
MAIRGHYERVPRVVRAQIVSVDPANRNVSAQLKDVGVVPVAVWDVPVAFRWPKEGEWWTLNYVQGYWHLGQIMEQTFDQDGVESPAPIETLSPGEMKLNSETVKDHHGRIFVAVDVSGLVDGDVQLSWDAASQSFVATNI